MDEYITRNNAILAVCLGCNQQFSDEPCEPSDCTIRRSIMALPAADVAPRAEVAREIFEEIEETLNRKIRRIEPEYERLDECFEKLSECGHSQHGYCKGVISTCEDLQDLIDELKKKYTEGQK